MRPCTRVREKGSGPEDQLDTIQHRDRHWLLVRASRSSHPWPFVTARLGSLDEPTVLQLGVGDRFGVNYHFHGS